ncbi:hypothetical protein HDV05_004265 [Chytridiales sp. JEL 0842]|nr:hypothetical protein HDV05_004265 [Chytridiales sp. JEL 0842]
MQGSLNQSTPSHNHHQQQQQQQQQNERDTFDYIIVGASPSGCMLAFEILERDPSATVCMIEAGELITTRWTTSDPFIGRNYSFVLSFLAKSYVHDLPKGKNVPSHIWTCVGKGVGGSSAINGMVWARPTELDLEEMLSPNFKHYAHKMRTIESFLGMSSDESNENGSLMDFAWMSELEKEGYPYKCYNSKELTQSVVGKKCVTRTLSACKGRDRIAGYDVLLKVKDHTRLILRGQTFVDRVIIQNGKAIGIRLEDGSNMYARNRVVLSAGAVFTPCVLMRSGIGSLADLERLDVVKNDSPSSSSGSTSTLSTTRQRANKKSASSTTTTTPPNVSDDRIPLSSCIINDAVGARLFDRYNIRLRYFTDSITYSDQRNLIFSNLQVFNSNTQISIEQPWYFLQYRSLYIYLRSLLLTFQFLTFFRTLLWFFSTPPRETSKPTFYNPFTYPRLPRFFMGSMIEFTTKIMIPQCGGRIHLPSKHPRALPVIDFDFFNDEKDVEDINKGFDMVTEWASKMPFMKNALPLFDPVKDRGNVKVYKSICDTGTSSLLLLRFWIVLKLNFLLVSVVNDTLDWHYAGTAPMGKVVDEDFKVVGVEGLYIVDMSVAKRSSSLNTMATAFLIGVLAADQWIPKQK